MKNFVEAAAILLVMGAVLYFVPMVLLWALNTLFGLAIPYNFTTWLAIVILRLSFVVTVPKA